MMQPAVSNANVLQVFHLKIETRAASRVTPIVE